MLNKQLQTRRCRQRESGFTMIEILVSLSIIAMLAAAMMGAYQIGLRALAGGGAGSRLTGAGNFSFLEQILGRDGGRATCATYNGTVYGYSASHDTCSTNTGGGGYAMVTQCSGAVLCFGWPQIGVAGPNFLDSTCHVAVYTAVSTPPLTAPNVIVTRSEYSVSMSGVVSPVLSTTINKPGTSPLSPFSAQYVALQFALQAPQPASYSPPGETYPWFRSMLVTLTASGVSTNPFAQTLALHPVSVDPDGAAAAVTSQGPPC